MDHRSFIWITVPLLIASATALQADQYNFALLPFQYGIAINDAGSYGDNLIFGSPAGCYRGPGTGSSQCSVGLVYDAPTDTATYYPDPILGLNNSGTVLTTTSVYSGGVAQPLPSSLQAAGINDYGEIVGSENVASGIQQAAQYMNGDLTTFVIPGAYSTEATGVNAAGTIVGYSYEADALGGVNGKVDGFVDMNGIFATVDYPGADQTYITAINNNGVLAGYYGRSYTQESFIYANGVFSSVDQIGVQPGMFPLPNLANGINDEGVVIGTQTNGNIVQTAAFFATPVSAVPEIDTNSSATSFVLLAGVLLIVRGRSPRV